MLTPAALQERGRKVCVVCADVRGQLAGIVEVVCEGQAGIQEDRSRHGSVQVIAQLFAAGRMAEFTKCFCLDLTDAFTGNVKLLTNFF